MMKVKQEQDKHRHHKQPQAFLNGFALTPSNPYQKALDIYVYKKGEEYRDGINPSLESVKDAGYSLDFYAFTKDDGNKDFNTYENILMKDFEQPAQFIFEKVRRFEEISDEERKIFLRYAASMVTRGDWWRKVSERSLENASAELKKELLGKSAGNDEAIRQLIEEETSRKRQSKSFNEGIIESAEKLLTIISKMNWRFIVTHPLYPFLTSDNPVFFQNFDSIDSELIFPVSSTIALSLSWKPAFREKGWRRRGKSYWDVDYKVVARTRKLICSIAINEVYFSQNRKWLVGLVNKQNDS